METFHSLRKKCNGHNRYDGHSFTRNDWSVSLILNMSLDDLSF